MYDEEGFQVANKLNRFAIGDRDDLTYNKNGSLDIYMQAKSPGKDKESNWLPSPDKDVLCITMRLYAPKAQALDDALKEQSCTNGKASSGNPLIYTAIYSALTGDTFKLKPLYLSSFLNEDVSKHWVFCNRLCLCWLF